MNSEKPTDPMDQDLSFGEKLLGMQSFSATRAKRYREELEKLLVHRVSTSERWTIGIGAIVIAAILIIAGAAMALAKNPPGHENFSQARLTFGVTCIITGLMLGAWLLRIALQGGYGRRLGDFMGVFITLLICGGLGFTFINMAWEVTDSVLRTKLLLVGGTLFAIAAAFVIVAHFQRLHRQTQEKLLRIEYHLAELMERNAESST